MSESGLIDNHEEFSNRWFKTSFFIMAANSVLLAPVSYFYPESIYSYFSFLLPGVNLFAWITVASLRKQTDSSESEQDEIYLKEKYHHIWKKLHPVGPLSRNGFAKVSFLLGTYDDDSDERLNKIKAKYKTYHKTSLKAFFMIPAIWLLNMSALAISSLAKHGI